MKKDVPIFSESEMWGLRLDLCWKQGILGKCPETNKTTSKRAEKLETSKGLKGGVLAFFWIIATGKWMKMLGCLQMCTCLLFVSWHVSNECIVNFPTIHPTTLEPRNSIQILQREGTRPKSGQPMLWRSLWTFIGVTSDVSCLFKFKELYQLLRFFQVFVDMSSGILFLFFDVFCDVVEARVQ